jgi:hemoglobin/transferrin/lactoferrin receptor protein
VTTTITPLVSIACLFVLPVIAYADSAAVVSGTIVDDTTGRPIGGARVDIVNGIVSDVTDEAGRFTLERVPSTATSVRVSADGYEAALASLGASQNGALSIRLRPTLRFDEAVVVAANREETVRTSVPRAVSVLTSEEIARDMPRTTPEALGDLPGVLVQKTNHGGGSPYIRGLVGNHVLILVDGVRLNNSTFRYGPNQYLATIDPGQIERVEVLRGSGSVLFGSDAVGGVINIVTRRPVLSGDGTHVSGTASGKLMSSDMEQSGRFDFSASGSRAAVVAGFSLRNYGHIRAGGDLGVESPSGYSELNGDGHALVRLSSNQSLEVGLQQVYQDDVPRFDQVAQRGFERYSFDPQIRRLGYVSWQRTGSSRWLRTLTGRVSYHQSVEKRERQQRGSRTQIDEQDEIGVAGISVEARSAPAPFWSIVSGVDYTHDRVSSWRRDTNVVSGVVANRRGLYPDGSIASSAAVFTHSSMKLGRTTVDGGVRYSQYSVSATDPLFGNLDIRPHAWVGSVAAMHDLASGFSLVGSVSQAFRAPNVDDVSTLGGFDFGIEVPSTDLVPETSVAYEAGVRVGRPAFGGSIVAYRTNLDNLIERVPAQFHGQDFYEGQRVYRRANVGRAHVYGVEADGSWDVSRMVGLFGNVSYTFGEVEAGGQPMRRIPPVNGLLGARLRLSPRAWVEGSMRAASKQDRLAPGDRDDHRIAPGGTPGWVAFNLSAGFPLFDQVDLVGGIHNLFDEAYRIHGSGIDEYGRAAWIAAHLRF